MAVSFSSKPDAGKVAEQAHATSQAAGQQTQGAMIGAFNSSLSMAKPGGGGGAGAGAAPGGTTPSPAAGATGGADPTGTT